MLWYWILVPIIIIGAIGFLVWQNLLSKILAGILAAALCLTVVPAVGSIGFNIAKTGIETYNEYWSGQEVTAPRREVKCEKDGSCIQVYNCDAYTVTVDHWTTDDKGNMTNNPTTEIRYHSCPYVTSEWVFTVTDTLGNTFTLGDHWFPVNPQNHLWRGYGWETETLPNVSTGEPPLWVEARNRIAANDPGGTTVRKQYKNYIQATQQDNIYRKYSDKIEQFKKDNLLPRLADSVHDSYYADKAYFVRLPWNNQSDYQKALQKFNGYFGKKQGDLHVVLVNSYFAPNGDDYTQALQAYWQSEEMGKNTLSKNGFVVVLGVNSGDIAWARGFTSMPNGNEVISQEVSNFTGKVAPESLLSVGDKSGGMAWNLLMDSNGGFQRFSMKNYEYLADSVTVPDGAYWWMALVTILISALAIGIAVGVSESYGYNNASDSFNRYLNRW